MSALRLRLICFGVSSCVLSGCETAPKFVLEDVKTYPSMSCQSLRDEKNKIQNKIQALKDDSDSQSSFQEVLNAISGVVAAFASANGTANPNDLANLDRQTNASNSDTQQRIQNYADESNSLTRRAEMVDKIIKLKCS